MDNDVIIRVNNLSKIYRIYDKPVDRLKETFFSGKYHREFHALSDISFDIKRGETVAFLGKNGAGKSTLLKLITGVATPTLGEVSINGRIAALLELGAGFNAEFTGIENIYMSGTIMGYTKEQMDEKMDEILAFADIGDFVYQQVKTYSSGMFARLAFAVNSNVNPDILIIDEALSVGDMFFQAKCMDKMKKMMDDGVTVLFVSHDTFAIKNLCKRGILLDSGKLVADGASNEVVEIYRGLQLSARQNVKNNALGSELNVVGKPDAVCFADNSLFLKNAAYQRTQNGKAEFYNIQLLNEQEEEITEVFFGQTVILRMAIIVNIDIDCFGTGYHIRNDSGVDLVYTDSKIDDKIIYNAKRGDKYVMDWKFKVELRDGAYNFSCVMSIPIDLSIGSVDCCDFVPCAVQFFQVSLAADKRLGGGYVHWHNDVDLRKV